MTPAGAVLRSEIARRGPVSFYRFMEVALYHPEHGYYRRGRDPFGKHGDYYTAEQIQPVFGLLIASLVESLARELGSPEDFQVVELGAGRGEMGEQLSRFGYTPIEFGDALPDRIRGLVLANEFFDALPVHVAVRRGDTFHEMLVGVSGERFVWVEGGPLAPALAARLGACAAFVADGAWIEIAPDAFRWIERIAARLAAGYLLVIDYGYTAPELARFPEGTLMSYRRHAAIGDVLDRPGEQDLTAHVPFTALEQHAMRCGFRTVRFESLARLLLAIGEQDQFARALEAPSDAERLRRRLQLKSLLFGMGESFRALLLARHG
jgi:SAM-dependent MidA family methyltransferase